MTQEKLEKAIAINNELNTLRAFHNKIKEGKWKLTYAYELPTSSASVTAKHVVCKSSMNVIEEIIKKYNCKIEQDIAEMIKTAEQKLEAL